MITRAVAAGVPFAWVTGDTVYGNDRKLRRWLEEQGRPYVLAVKSNEPLWADREGGAAQVAARDGPTDGNLALVMAQGAAPLRGLGADRARVGAGPRALAAVRQHRS